MLGSGLHLLRARCRLPVWEPSALPLLQSSTLRWGKLFPSACVICGGKHSQGHRALADLETPR